MSDRLLRGLNRVTLIGRLGRRPEMRYTPTGRPVTSFSVVMTLVSTNSETERRTKTDWFNVVAWGDLAETCKQTLSKDQPVYVEGRLKTRHWQDADQVDHTQAEIVAHSVYPLALSQDKR